MARRFKGRKAVSLIFEPTSCMVPKGEMVPKLDDCNLLLIKAPPVPPRSPQSLREHKTECIYVNPNRPLRRQHAIKKQKQHIDKTLPPPVTAQEEDGAPHAKVFQSSVVLKRYSDEFRKRSTSLEFNNTHKPCNDELALHSLCGNNTTVHACNNTTTSHQHIISTTISTLTESNEYEYESSDNEYDNISSFKPPPLSLPTPPLLSDNEEEYDYATDWCLVRDDNRNSSSSWFNHNPIINCSDEEDEDEEGYTVMRWRGGSINNDESCPVPNKFPMCRLHTRQQ